MTTPEPLSVLVVEDDSNKRNQITAFLTGSMPDRLAIREARSYTGGLRQILTTCPDIILLDMTLPTFDVLAGDAGGRIRFFAGREILYEMRRRRISCRVIVVTQFESFGDGAESMSLEQLREQIAKEFPETYRGTVFYQSSEARWRDELHGILASIVDP